MRPPSGWTQLSDPARQRWLEDRGLILVRGHMVRAEVVRTIGLDGTWRQLQAMGVGS